MLIPINVYINSRHLNNEHSPSNLYINEHNYVLSKLSDHEQGATGKL